MDRNQKILIVISLLFAVSLVYRLTHPFKHDEVSILTYSGKSIKNVNHTNRFDASIFDNKGKYPHVRLDLILNQPQHSGNVIKNIFQRNQLLVENIKPLQLITHETAIETEPLAIEKETYSFKVFGSSRNEDKRMLFIENGKNVLIIQNGDKIDGKHLVDDITDTSFTIITDGHREIVPFNLK